MNDELEKKWKEAEQTGEPVPIGDLVICDFCDEDYTESNESGGFIFGSQGVCPKCADRMMKSIKKYNEEKYIRVVCKPDQSFADFIREYRGPHAYIRVLPMK